MEILLSSLNSSYKHSSFGLRYLLANLKELASRAKILEFTTEKHPRDIVEILLAQKPRIVGFGVYIWNTKETFEVVSLLKRVAPEVIVVLGGPEVSYETEKQALCQTADYVIKGEADFLFYDFCKTILLDGSAPATKFISGSLPNIAEIKSPYFLYNDEDIKNRTVYVEASRGCPYKCEYCLSSLDKSVRNFPIDAFLADLQSLIDRGTRQFKFIDRTFNLSPTISTRILQFFLERIELGLFLHFEMVPDRLPAELKELIKKFPAGSLQFEVGLQTLNPVVAQLVSRKNDMLKVEENLRFLNSETGVHIHADLIAGLPGEDIHSFARGFDLLTSWGPHEVQVGILKRLRGTPIIRHDQEWQMVYQESTPYQILRTKSMSYEELQKMNRFSRYWDMIANSGRFKKAMELLKKDSESLFWSFFDLSEFLYERLQRSHQISLNNLSEALYSYLTEKRAYPSPVAEQIFAKDYLLGTRQNHATPKRQLQHLTSH